MPARSATLVAALTLMLAACAMPPEKDGLTYRAPEVRTGAGTVAVPGASRAEAVAGVAARLRAAGFRVSAANPRTGRVVARFAGQGLVDCGTFTQVARGNVASFPAHAVRAAVFDPASPGQILLRQVATSTQLTIEVEAAAPFAARIGAQHEVRVSQAPVGNSPRGWQATRQFAEGATATFPDQVTCTGAGRLGSIVSGR